MKLKKRFLLTILLFLLIFSLCLAFFLFTGGDEVLDIKKLSKYNSTIEFYDKNGSLLTFSSAEKSKTEINKLPTYVKNAFVALEDARFYKHNGIDYRAILRASFNNLKSFKLKEGASTISQQLIKNTHLSSEKTLKRKIKEYKLTKKLEKRYSKDEILSMYLNTIYFGKNAYGIDEAALKYFSKSPEKLTIAESAVLASLIKAPSKYSKEKNREILLKRRNLTLKKMYEQKYISKSEYEKSVAEDITFTNSNENFYEKFYFNEAYEELDDILEDFSPYGEKKYKVFTYFNPEIQQVLYSENKNNYNYSAVFINNKTHGIEGYYAVNKDENLDVGSTLKPLCVYGPCINENIVSECSPVLDEKTSFNGYTPKNYHDSYLGKITVRKSLEVSSNVVSCKLLNYLTPSKAAEYLKKQGLTIEKEDENLSLALGCKGSGESIKDLTSAYTVFTNNGNFYKPKFIEKIEKNGLTIYKNNQVFTNVFENDTCEIMNYMLSSVVNSGTAKKLKLLKKDIAAKTGTVGSEIKNRAALCVSYTNNYTLGVRLSGDLPVSITGGGLPTDISYNVWKEVKNKSEPFSRENIVKKELDKYSFDSENRLVLSDEIAPKEKKTEGYFRFSNIPKEKSTRYSKPVCENGISQVNYNRFYIRLCQIEYINYLVYKSINGKKSLILDTSTGKYEIKDDLNINGAVYEYSVIPYSNINGIKRYGEEKIIKKIKCDNLIDEWWK